MHIFKINIPNISSMQKSLFVFLSMVLVLLIYKYICIYIFMNWGQPDVETFDRLTHKTYKRKLLASQYCSLW